MPHIKNFVKIFLFIVLPIIILLGIISTLLVLYNINPLVRNRIVSILEKQFPNTDIQYESIEFIPYQGIRIHGLQIQIPENAFLENSKYPLKKEDLILPETDNGIHKFLSIEEIFIAAPISRLELVVKGVTNPNIQIDNTDVYLYPISLDRWNFQYLSLRKDIEQKQTPFDQLTLKNAHLHVHDSRKKSHCDCYTLQDIDAQIKLTSNNEYAITSIINDSLSKTIEITGTYNPDKKQLKLTGKVNRYEISERLLNLLPLECESVTNIQYLKSFTGDFLIKVSTSYDKSLPPGKNIKYQIDGKLTNGKLICNIVSNDFNAFDNIDGIVNISESKLIVQSLCIKMGNGAIKLVYQQDGYSQNAKKDVTIHLKKIRLDEKQKDFIKKLMEKNSNKTIVSAFLWLLSGTSITTEIKLTFDGNHWNVSIPGLPFF